MDQAEDGISHAQAPRAEDLRCRSQADLQMPQMNRPKLCQEISAPGAGHSAHFFIFITGEDQAPGYETIFLAGRGKVPPS